MRWQAIWNARTAALLATVSLGIAPGVLYADGPAMATAEDPDDLIGHTENVNDLRASTENPNDLRGSTEDPDTMVVGTEDPEDMVVGTEDLDSLVVETYKLSDLPEETSETRPPASADRHAPRRQPRGEAHTQSFTPSGGTAESGSSDASASSLTAQLAEARARVDHSKRALAHWDAEYSRAVTNGTARGQARADIVASREKAGREHENALQELHELAGKARRAGVNRMMIDGFTQGAR